MMTQAIDPFLTVEMARKNIFPNVVPLKHGGVNKEVRIKGLLPRYERGHVYHITGLCLDLERELVRFPASAHDDTMDSLAYQNFLAEAPNTDFDIDEFTAQELAPSQKTYSDIGI
jgi:phage terminase large subunit-like protein